MQGTAAAAHAANMQPCRLTMEARTAARAVLPLRHLFLERRFTVSPVLSHVCSHLLYVCCHRRGCRGNHLLDRARDQGRAHAGSEGRLIEQGRSVSTRAGDTGTRCCQLRDSLSVSQTPPDPFSPRRERHWRRLKLCGRLRRSRRAAAAAASGTIETRCLAPRWQRHVCADWCLASTFPV